MKNKKKLFIILIAAIVIIAIAFSAFFIFLHKRSSSSPESAVREFYNSLLPTYNAEMLEQSVGTKPYQIRFNDKGYFVDRYERTREQIVYYYGDKFESTLSDFVLSDVNDTEKASIQREYSSEYALEIEEVKKVSFSVTLSSEGREKSRNVILTTLKIDGEWFIYDYDAYWFAYM